MGGQYTNHVSYYMCSIDINFDMDITHIDPITVVKIVLSTGKWVNVVITQINQITYVIGPNYVGPNKIIKLGPTK